MITNPKYTGWSWWRKQVARQAKLAHLRERAAESWDNLWGGLTQECEDWPKGFKPERPPDYSRSWDDFWRALTDNCAAWEQHHTTPDPTGDLMTNVGHLMPMDLEDDNPYRATDLDVLYSGAEPFYSDYQEIE